MAFGLLGPLAVSRLGRAINVTAGRQRAVLATSRALGDSGGPASTGSRLSPATPNSARPRPPGSAPPWPHP